MFRRATPADAAAIRDLTRSAYAKWVPLIGREPKPMGADYDAATRHHLIELLFRGETLLGLAEMIPQTDHLLLENIAVAPAHQGQGLGRALLARVEATARALGHAEIRLYTNARFTENIALYRRLGYRLDREEVVPLGTVTHMSKRLGPTGTTPG